MGNRLSTFRGIPQKQAALPPAVTSGSKRPHPGSDYLNDVDQAGVTEMRTDRFGFEWDFAPTLLLEEQEITSPPYHGDAKQKSWLMKISEGGDSVTLVCIPEKGNDTNIAMRKNVEAKFTIELQDCSGKWIRSDRTEGCRVKFNADNNWSYNYSCKTLKPLCQEMVTKSNGDQDRVFIRCKLLVLSLIQEVQYGAAVPKQRKLVPEQDLLRIVAPETPCPNPPKQFLNFHLIPTDGGVVKTNKAMFCKKCPDFVASLKLRTNARVVDVPLCKQFVEYILEAICTGNITPREDTDYKKLFKETSQYNLAVLNKAVQKILVAQVNINTAADMLKYARRVNARYVMLKVVSFINANYNEVKNTTGFGHLSARDLDLLYELYNPDDNDDATV